MSKKEPKSIEQKDNYHLEYFPMHPELCDLHVRHLSKELDLKNAVILELACGESRWTKAIKKKFPDCTIHCVDINEESRPHAESIGTFECADLLHWAPSTDLKPSMIIGNLPFSISCEILYNVFSYFPNTPTCILQKEGWMSTRKRAEFFREHPVNFIHFCQRRWNYLERDDGKKYTPTWGTNFHYFNANHLNEAKIKTI